MMLTFHKESYRERKWIFNMQRKRNAKKSNKEDSNPRPQRTYGFAAGIASDYLTRPLFIRLAFLCAMDY